MKWLIPPVLVALCLLLMIALRNTFPIATILQNNSTIYIGSPFILIGLSFIFITAYNFKEVETNIHTFHKPNKLITSGLFQFSRNPIYLGFLLILLGAAINLNAISTFIGPIIFFLAANFWYIPFEEEAATSQFGNEYLEYKNKVRRWI